MVDGFLHILEGTDHPLFIVCLVQPLRRLRALVVMATAFTLSHSLTLATAVPGLAPHGLWFAPLVEWSIAASIVAMALANVLGGYDQRRWIAAFAFGLVRGFGFACAGAAGTRCASICGRRLTRHHLPARHAG